MTPAQQKSMSSFFGVAGPNSTNGLIYANKLRPNERAHAIESLGIIALDPKAPHHTVWHECAHHIECNNKEVLNAALGFRNYRAKKDSHGSLIVKPLNELDKKKLYDEHERAVMDNFTSTYTGKICRGQGATEVVSMGMGMLAQTSEFKKTVEKDPELLHFVIGMLHHLNTK